MNTITAGLGNKPIINKPIINKLKTINKMMNSINKLKEISTIDKAGILIGILFILPMTFVILKHIIINGATL